MSTTRTVPPAGRAEPAGPTPSADSATQARAVCRTLLKSIGDDNYVREGLAKLRRSAADADTLRQRILDFVAQDGASLNRLEALLPRTLPELRELVNSLSADFR